MSRHTPPPRGEPDAAEWQSEYEQWAQEQDDADEINRMLREAEDANE